LLIMKHYVVLIEKKKDCFRIEQCQEEIKIKKLKN
jgi:hypothetical protein